MKLFQDLVRAQPDSFFATGARPELLPKGAERDRRGFTIIKPRSTTCRATHQDVRGEIFRLGLAALGPEVAPTIDPITDLSIDATIDATIDPTIDPTIGPTIDY